MISALTGDGVARSASAGSPRACRQGPWLYPEDQITDVPLRQLAAEITREKLYLRLHQELPYQSTVETESWKERKDGSVRIEQTIYVERESQTQDRARQGRPDHQGDRRGRARARSPRSLEQPVHLFLFVKVRENWGDDPERYREMGLEFPKRRCGHLRTTACSGPTKASCSASSATARPASSSK